MGYGVCSTYKKERALAHRVAYELYKGPFPTGMVIDHLCRRPACVNPNHLDAVTMQENLRRGNHYERDKVVCDHGHPFDLANTRMWRGGRLCRACNRLAVKKYRKEGGKCA